MLGINTRIGQLLHADHLNTIAALQRLEAFLVHQTTKKIPARDDARALACLKETARIVQDEVGRHFGFEETHLFPALADAGESGMTDFLAEEHASILPVAVRAGELAKKALNEGFAAEEWQEFHALGLELVEREIFHIQKEEMGLLAAIGALLDAETDGKLAETFAAFTGRG